MNTNAISAIGAGISMQSSQQSHQHAPPNAIVKPPQMLNPALQQERTRHSVNMNEQPQLLQHQMSNHLNVGPTMNHSGLSNNSGMQNISNMQMLPTMQSPSGIYDHMHPNGKDLLSFLFLCLFILDIAKTHPTMASFDSIYTLYIYVCICPN